MACVLGPGNGTTISSDNKLVELKSTVDSKECVTILTDASYSGADGTFYSVLTGDRGEDSSAITKFTTVAAGYRNLTGETAAEPYAKDTINYAFYYAASWTMTFKYEFQGNIAAQDLFLNFTAANGTVSTATATKKTDGDSGESKKGFRMALQTGSALFVWAPFADAIGNHVTGANTTAAWATSGTTTVLAGLSGTDTKLGQITTTAPNTTGQLVVNCYAWFEGTDHTNVINTTEIDTIVSALGFYAKTAE